MPVQWKRLMTDEQIEEVVGEEIAVKIQSSTKRSFIWKDKAVFG